MHDFPEGGNHTNGRIQACLMVYIVFVFSSSTVLLSSPHFLSPFFLSSSVKIIMWLIYRLRYLRLSSESCAAQHQHCGPSVNESPNSSPCCIHHPVSVHLHLFTIDSEVKVYLRLGPWRPAARTGMAGRPFSLQWGG